MLGSQETVSKWLGVPNSWSTLFRPPSPSAKLSQEGATPVPLTLPAHCARGMYSQTKSSFGHHSEGPGVQASQTFFQTEDSFRDLAGLPGPGHRGPIGQGRWGRPVSSLAALTQPPPPMAMTPDNLRPSAFACLYPFVRLPLSPGTLPQILPCLHSPYMGVWVTGIPAVCMCSCPSDVPVRVTFDLSAVPLRLLLGQQNDWQTFNQIHDFPCSKHFSMKNHVQCDLIDFFHVCCHHLRKYAKTAT